jgi:hypothetical protein
MENVPAETPAEQSNFEQLIARLIELRDNPTLGSTFTDEYSPGKTFVHDLVAEDLCWPALIDANLRPISSAYSELASKGFRIWNGDGDGFGPLVVCIDIPRQGGTVVLTFG